LASGARQFVVLRVVDAEDDGNVGAFGRRRDDHPLGARGQVLRRIVPIGEEARAFEDDLDAEFLPGQLRRVAHGQDLEVVPVDGNPVLAGFDLGVQVPEDRVVLQQVRERGRAREVVDRHEVDVLVTQRRAHDVAADTPESIDADLNRHRILPSGTANRSSDKR
jgi:hypothetical protein